MTMPPRASTVAAAGAAKRAETSSDGPTATIFPSATATAPGSKTENFASIATTRAWTTRRSAFSFGAEAFFEGACAAAAASATSPAASASRKPRSRARACPER